MPKKSRALQEIEAMEFAARRELAEVETVRAKIAAKLDTLQDMKTRMEKDPMKRKPKKLSNHEKAVKLLDEAAAGIRQRNAVPMVGDMAPPASVITAIP